MTYEIWKAKLDRLLKARNLPPITDAQALAFWNCNYTPKSAAYEIATRS